MIRIDHVTFSYGEENENAGGVHDINLTVEDGQCVVLCGESGSGKTTITRLINGLIPHYYEGKMNGEVWVNGAKVSEQPLYDTAKTVGSVFQNPRSQFFNVDTTSEITFGCENLGQPEQSIRERLDKTIRDFRLEKLMGRNIFHLSGGEKQKIACAGVSIMEPDVLVMDEPSSNLDASSILDLRAILAFWKSQGKTIIVSDEVYTCSTYIHKGKAHCTQHRVDADDLYDAVLTRIQECAKAVTGDGTELENRVKELCEEDTQGHRESLEKLVSKQKDRLETLDRLIAKLYDDLINDKITDGEVDFVAQKQNDRLYVQVTQEIKSEKTEKREYERLLEIRDNYPKYVLRTDEFAGGNYQGIKSMHIADFLLSTEY